jgi:hypothetical protein
MKKQYQRLGKKYNYSHTQTGPKTRCKNYRALCLPTVLMKLYSRILDKRPKKEIEDNLEEEQRTFRLTRQMQDHVCTMRIATDKLLSKGRDTYMVFLDLKRSKGVKQRDSLSPLPLIFMEHDLKTIQEKNGEDSDWILEHVAGVHSGISVWQ